MWKLALALPLIACTQPAPQNAALPWLHGFTPIAVTDVASPSISQRLRPWQACDEPCPDYGGLEVVADIGARKGDERILVSFASGVVVLDAADRLIARGSPYEPMGSADEVVALAVGDGMLEAPVIAVVVSRGGRRESTVVLELYRFARGDTLEPLFSGVVENHDETGDTTGTVTLVRNGVLYKAPRARVSILRTFDR